MKFEPISDFYEGKALLVRGPDMEQPRVATHVLGCWYDVEDLIELQPTEYAPSLLIDTQGLLNRDDLPLAS